MSSAPSHQHLSGARIGGRGFGGQTQRLAGNPVDTGVASMDAPLCWEVLSTV